MNLEEKRIVNVSDFLSEVGKTVKELKRISKSSVICYRGEGRLVGESGEKYVHSMPNIFRYGLFERFSSHKWFEKAILDEVKSNNLSRSDNYLEIAIDAQHGGFPSRLLDISFNSLIALFFATTPHYTMKVNTHDDVDGRVLVYAFDKMTTSKTRSIIEIYERIIDKKDHSNRFESNFHYLIDFVDLNPRIRAQQGGFILFGGNQFVPITENRVREIIIPGEAKKRIREELDLYFGVNMGSIYPEPENKVDYIGQKIPIIENEVDYLSAVKEEIEFHINSSLEYIRYGEIKDKKKKIEELAIYFYEVYFSFFELSKKTTASEKIEEVKKLLNQKLEEINSLEGEIIDPNLWDKLSTKTKGDENEE